MRQAGPNSRRARGFLLVVAILVVLVVAVAVAALGNMTSSDVRSSAAHAQSVQAFYLAESGLEVEQRRWAQNLNWYRSTTDPNPNPASAQTLGTGSFTAYANLPATLLKKNLPAVANTITVYSTDRFPTSGCPAGCILQIEEDLTASAEFVSYTGIVGNTFTGVARNQLVGSLNNPAGPQSHPRSDAVYPVTTLVNALSAFCTATPTPTSFPPIQIVYNSKFLSAGTIDIEGEEMSYSGSSVAGGVMTLKGVMRCVGNLPGPISHAAGQPVTPVLIGGDSADYEVETVATGAVGSNIRYARRTIQR